MVSVVVSNNELLLYRTVHTRTSSENINQLISNFSEPSPVKKKQRTFLGFIKLHLFSFKLNFKKYSTKHDFRERVYNTGLLYLVNT